MATFMMVTESNEGEGDVFEFPDDCSLENCISIMSQGVVPKMIYKLENIEAKPNPVYVNKKSTTGGSNNMKILLQDKTGLVSIPKELWVASGPTESLIVGTSYKTPYFGTYETKERATEVLGEIYEAYKNNEVCYEMPSR